MLLDAETVQLLQEQSFMTCLSMFQQQKLLSLRMLKVRIKVQKTWRITTNSNKNVYMKKIHYNFTKSFVRDLRSGKIL